MPPLLSTSPALTVARNEMAKRLEQRIGLGKGIQALPIKSFGEISKYMEQADKWADYNCVLLKRSFTNLELWKEYSDACLGMIMSRREGGIFTDLTALDSYRRSINNQIERLEALLATLELYTERPTAPQVPVRMPAAASPHTSRVFVVHGHDEGAHQAATRFLERLGLETVILREQPDAGRTIIEKFVDYADHVGFAVVLLTPDDLSGPPAARAVRARQNVIFELGSSPPNWAEVESAYFAKERSKSLRTSMASSTQRWMPQGLEAQACPRVENSRL
jgi:hypothetical protein